MPLAFDVQTIYQGPGSPPVWRGTKVIHPQDFDALLTSKVKDRLDDVNGGPNFEADLQALATAEVDTQTLDMLLNSKPPLLDWEVGEALAECLLCDEDGATWPWNEDRDRKTPKASLPGADIVGFIGPDDDACFLFGEVKTSTEKKCPPGVLHGRSGLIHQIDTLASQTNIHRALLKWLHARCVNTAFWPKYQSAVRRYLKSKGQDFMLVGVLLRDTDPDQLDLQARGNALAASIKPPLRFRLDAWYLPRRCSDWPAIVQSAGAP